MRKKIMIIFGTRPEAIKMASLVHSLKAHNKDFNVQICVTAQHREMLDQVLKLFKIRPNFDLNLMTISQDLSSITSSMTNALGNLLKKNRPNLVLVHGDTTTAFVAALTAFYNDIKVGHIEAGLRTNNLLSPFPEELNRQIISKIATYHFVPTILNKENLLRENIKKKKIIITGNTIVDSLSWALTRIKNNLKINKKITQSLNTLLNFDLNKKKFILITGHRRENFGWGFKNICYAIKKLAITHKDIQFVYPVHLNPKVKNYINAILNKIPNVHLITPQSYEIFIYLMQKSYLILTDSGGIQEEAPSLGKPVLIMRDVTERKEVISSGAAILLGANKEKIIKSVSLLLNNKKIYNKMLLTKNPYGDGRACNRIVKFLLKNYDKL
jgi:UDP-N-acetylglucosamine 2-epimerase (non-hydrolysing)